MARRQTTRRAGLKFLPSDISPEVRFIDAIEMGNARPNRNNPQTNLSGTNDRIRRFRRKMGVVEAATREVEIR